MTTILEHAAFGLGATLARPTAWRDATTPDGTRVRVNGDASVVHAPLIPLLAVDAADMLADMLAAAGSDETPADAAPRIAETLAESVRNREKGLNAGAVRADALRAFRRVRTVKGKNGAPDSLAVTYVIGREGGRTVPLGVGAIADAIAETLDAVAETYGAAL